MRDIVTKEYRLPSDFDYSLFESTEPKKPHIGGIQFLRDKGLVMLGSDFYGKGIISYLHHIVGASVVVDSNTFTVRILGSKYAVSTAHSTLKKIIDGFQ